MKFKAITSLLAMVSHISLHTNRYLFLALIFMPLLSAASAFGKRSITIMGFGDSITEGGKGFSTYLYPLWEQLYVAGYDFAFIGPRQSESRIGMLRHCGFSGKNTEFLDQQTDSIYRNYPADIVLIHSGHNHFASQKPVDGIIRSYRSIIRKMRAVNPDVYIFLAQVTPSGKLPKYSYIQELNKQIASLVESYSSSHIILVDMATGHDWKTMTISDKVHPNKLGREYMADKWFKALAKVLGPSPRIFHPQKVAYKGLVHDDSLQLHVFRPAQSNGRALVYLFAGGWKYGSPLQFYREAKYYSEKGLTVFCVDYRISSLYHSTPSNAFEDCADAMTFIRHHAKDYKIRPDSIALAGASAGGNMALCLAEGVGGKEARPNLLITYYPTLEEPSRHIASDIPPVKFIIGDKDQFTPEDTALTFVEHLRDVGSRVEFHLLKGYGHPIFHYRESLNSVFYYIRALTDDFLRRYKFLL